MTDVKELIERLEVVSGTMLDWSDNNYETASKLNGEQAVQFQNQGNEFAEWSSLIKKGLEALTHLSEQNAKRLELDEVHKDRRGDFHSVYDELHASRNFLASEGYRRCDIAACNCLSWHDHGPQGYNGLRQEIEDLEEQNAAKDKEIAEARELMSNLYHAVQHKRDVWETASASQKVFASNDLNVAMANIEISESYKAYCLSLSEGET